MQKEQPKAVEYEEYFTKDGFDKSKLITDINSERISELVNKLAELEIGEKVEGASNFSVKHYNFTSAEVSSFCLSFTDSILK